MSLLKELSEDRRYVLGVKRTDNPSDQQMEDAAIAILRKVIAPTFRKMHYDGNYRTEKTLQIVVDFSEERSYTITPRPSWNFSHRGVEYSKECNYCYMENFSKNALWTKVAIIACQKEWEIKADFSQICQNILLLSLNMEA